MLWLITYPIYLIRRVIFAMYQLMVFISKPAARWLLPLAIIGLAGWQSERVLAFIALPDVTNALHRWVPIPPRETELYAIITLFALIAALLLLSWVLRSFLGAFPPMRKPLPPARALRARNLIKRPASAKIVVPVLRHRFRKEYQANMERALPPAIQTMLKASQKPHKPQEAPLAAQSPPAAVIEPERPKKQPEPEKEQRPDPTSPAPLPHTLRPETLKPMERERKRPPPPPQKPPMPQTVKQQQRTPDPKPSQSSTEPEL